MISVLLQALDHMVQATIAHQRERALCAAAREVAEEAHTTLL